MAFRTTLPAPKWQGFETDCLEKFLRFALDKRTASTQKRQRKLQDTIAELEREIRTLGRWITTRTTAIATSQQRLAAVQRRIDNQPIDMKQLEAEVRAIVQLPFVTNIHIHEDGYPVVHMALSDPQSQRVFAEITVDFDLQRNYYGQLWVAQRALQPSKGIFWSNRRGPWDDEPERHPTGHLLLPVNMTLPGIVTAYCEYLERANARWSRWRIISRRVHRKVLDGYDIAQLTDAFKKWRTDTTFADLVTQRQNLEDELHENQDSLQRNREALRQAHGNLRAARSEHAAFENGSHPSVNAQDVAQEFLKILTLPGVMGLRFAKDGTPIFHVRSSVLRNGHRYDIGDYEIRFRTISVSEGVVNVHATRGGSKEYYHPSSYDTRADWFCFGGRAQEMSRRFKRAEYASFMNLLINSLNSLNKGDRKRQQLVEAYNEIPVDLVWRTEIPKTT